MKFKLFGIVWDFTNIILSVYVVINPMFWIQVEKQSKSWDRALRKELENPLFTAADKYTVKLNGKRIWIANYPYGYGCNYTNMISGDLPTRKTRFLLRSALKDKRNYVERKNEGNIISFK